MLNFLLDIAPDKSQLLLTIHQISRDIAGKETRGILYLHLKPCFYACTI